jgi:hypothetical protein
MHDMNTPSVDILATAREDLRGIMRLRRAAGLSERRARTDAPDMHLHEAHPASS